MKYNIKGLTAKTPNANGYVYSPDAVKQMAEQINSQKNILIDGEVGDGTATSIDNALGMVVEGSAKVVNGQLTYKIKTLDTPQGNAFVENLNMTTAPAIMGDILDEYGDSGFKEVLFKQITKIHAINADDAKYPQREEIDE
jgi:hypothetical protein